jgi:hypothetical protein
MSYEIKNTTSRAEIAANGTWYVLLNGQVVYDERGKVKSFPTEAAARAYLAGRD